jgi:ABC-type transporter Mla subunit MlaD
MFSRQAQLGLFAVAALLLLFGIFYVITDFGTRHSGYRLGVHFASAAGLPTGAQVFFSGVTVGTVDEIELLPDNSVDVILAIQNDINIPRDSRFLIQAPITGTPNMLIVPPIPKRLPPGYAATPLPQSAILPKRVLPVPEQPVGYAAPTFGDLAAEGQGEVRRLDAMMAQLQVSEPKLLRNLTVAMSNVDTMTTQLQGTIADLSGTLDETMQTVGSHFSDMAVTMDSTMQRNSHKIDRMLTALTQTSVALNSSMNVLQSLATDPRLKGNVIATTQNLRDLTGNLADLTGNLQSITGSPQTQMQLKDTLANLDATMQKADSLLGTLGGKSHVYGVDAGATPYPVPSEAAPTLPPGTQTPSPSGRAGFQHGLSRIAGDLVQLRMRVGELDSGAEPQADLNAYVLPHGRVSGMFGVNDLGGRTTWNLAAVKNAGGFHYGGGVLYSQLGGLASYDGRLFGAETRVYDLSRPTFDIYGNMSVAQWARIFFGERDVTRSTRHAVYGLELKF